MEDVYRGNIFGRELVGCVRDEETSLSDGAVTDDHTLDGLHPRQGLLSQNGIELRGQKLWINL